jgi:hypothetical protein
MEKQSIGVTNTPSKQFTIFETRDFSIFKKLSHNRSTSKNKSNLRALKKSMSSVRGKNLLTLIIVNEFMEIIDGQHRVKVYEELYANTPLDERPTLHYVICKGYGLEECRAYNKAGKTWDGHDFLESYVSQGMLPYQQFEAFMNTHEFLDYWITLRILTGTINVSTRAKSKATKGEDVNDLFREGRLTIDPENLRKGKILVSRIQEILDNGWYEGDKASRTFIVTMSRIMASKNFDFDVFKEKMEKSRKKIYDVQKMDTIAQQIEAIYNKKEPLKTQIKIPTNVKSKNSNVIKLRTKAPNKKSAKKTTTV